MNFYLLLIYFLALCWICSIAIIEARADHYNLNFSFLCKSDPDKHIHYSISRMFVFLLIFFLSKNILLLISIIFAFPFWHNGIYFSVRNYLFLSLKYKKEIIPYPKWWFDEGSTAILDRFLNKYIRTFFAILSIIILILLINQNVKL